jgi:hypothetical protein
MWVFTRKPFFVCEVPVAASSPKQLFYCYCECLPRSVYAKTLGVSDFGVKKENPTQSMQESTI